MSYFRSTVETSIVLTKFKKMSYSDNNFVDIYLIYNINTRLFSIVLILTFILFSVSSGYGENNIQKDYRGVEQSWRKIGGITAITLIR